MFYTADIGVIGGSGLYSLGLEGKNVTIDTPYGKTSAPVTLIKYKGMTIAFLPRHGAKHTLAPQEINYRANIDAMAQLGVKAIISPNCVGSLREDYAPGEFVVTDQYINFTSGRKDTYFESPTVVSLSNADPYDEKLRKYAVEECRLLGIPVHDEGTTAVFNGPRFSTRAESNMYKWMGADLVNMTQYPEAYLAKEKQIPIVNVALVTDYDAGLKGKPGIKPVTTEEVLQVLAENNKKVVALIFRMCERIGRK